MTMGTKAYYASILAGAAGIALALTTGAQARAPKATGKAPESILPEAPAVPAPLPAPVTPAPVGTETPPPVIAPVPVPAPQWSARDAETLLAYAQQIGSEGLIPADYQLDALRAALSGGASEALNLAATQTFTWLAEDLRDGRTPMTARVQWFAVDPDIDASRRRWRPLRPLLSPAAHNCRPTWIAGAGWCRISARCT